MEIKGRKIVQTATKELIEDRRDALEWQLRHIPEKVNREAILAVLTKAVLGEMRNVLSPVTVAAAWDQYEQTLPLIRKLLRHPYLLDILESSIKARHGEPIPLPPPRLLPMLQSESQPLSVLRETLTLLSIPPPWPKRGRGRQARPWKDTAMKELLEIGVIAKATRVELLRAVGVEKDPDAYYPDAS
ncbi:MAG: hypothetical protein V3V07_05815 [candidate division NC10 bacterium]|nr:hypothetical protein [candidate division NC10 bacterium]